MWKVIRHSGCKNDRWKVKHEDEQNKIVDKYFELKDQIKRGGVGLVNASDQIVSRFWIWSVKESRKIEKILREKNISVADLIP